MGIRPFLPTSGKITPMQLLIFMQLLEGPKYGYEILTNLRDDFDGIWLPKTGTVYPALKALVKKGFISENSVKDTTYYKLTKEGLSLVSDPKELVKEYVLFNYQFMKVAAERLPPDFTMVLLMNLYELGIDDMTPETSILEAIEDLPDKEVQKHLLTHRKRVLQDKLKIIRRHLKTLER